jgi:CubicO group peptidase (beta-lactamase class C family)
MISMRRLCIALVVMVALGVLPARAQKPVTAELAAALERVEALVKAELAKDNVGSVTVGVVADGALVWTRSFGYADMERKIPADAATVYRIGSITKQFTGVMLLQLVEKAAVRLSDPVEKYFPEVKGIPARQAAPPITLVQLATMTSGLEREPLDLATYLKGPVAEWEKVLISALPKVQYRFEPDTRFYYSNVGYAILGAALARASARPYVDYVREKILLPLGMEHTAFEPNARIEPHLAKGYDVGRDKVDSETPAREHQGRGYKVPNGALYTTVGDLARFVAFELGDGPETVLPRKSWAENLTRTNSSSGELASGYGIGFMAQREGEIVTYGHSGSVAGYVAAAYFHPKSKIGIVVLRNVTGGKFALPVNRVLRDLAEARKPRS